VYFVTKEVVRVITRFSCAATPSTERFNGKLFRLQIALGTEDVACVIDVTPC
jgi:hypothetical protein